MISNACDILFTIIVLGCLSERSSCFSNNLSHIIVYTFHRGCKQSNKQMSLIDKMPNQTRISLFWTLLKTFFYILTIVVVCWQKLSVQVPFK